MRSIVVAVALALAACGGRGGSTKALPPAASNAVRVDRHDATPPNVWVQPEMVRVGPSAQPRPGARRDATLESARNQTVSFQIVVTAPPQGLRNVRVGAGAFGVRPDSSSPIASALYREHFIDIPHASAVFGHPHSLGAGTYPDGLIPFVDDFTGKPPKPSRLRAQPIDLAGERTQPYWIDVTVPATTAAGDYRAVFAVSSDSGTASVTARLHVWRFTMPSAPSEDSDFQFNDSTHANVASQEELLRNRLQPNPVSASSERRLSHAFGLELADADFWGGAYYGHCTLAQPPAVATLERAVDRQSVPLVYNQEADEIGACKNFRTTLVPIVKRWARNLHAAGALNLLTMQPVPALEDDGSGQGRPAIDIWTMLPVEYAKAVKEVHKVVAKGQRAWWYTALAQDRFSPKWEIDVPPGDYRIEPLIDASLGLTGELYWAVDYWHPNAWDDVEYDAGSGEYFAGEGILTYPGADVGTVGVAPSMRLKWIRDGMYDADEVTMLEACGQRDWTLRLTRGIAEDFHHWTGDPKAIERVRHALSARLDSSCS